MKSLCLAVLDYISSHGARAWLLYSLWYLPGLGFKLVSPVLVGRFFTPEPQGKPY